MAEPCVREDRAGFLRDCIVEGDSAEQRGVQRRKRRALLVSIILQILIVAALVLFPLFSKGENITSRALYVPTVPYSPGRPHTQNKPAPHPTRTSPSAAHFFQPSSIPPTITTHDRGSVIESLEPLGTEIPGVPEGKPILGAPPIMEAHHDTPPPPPAKERIRVSASVIAAQLVRRVQPTYPTLAVQIRREGRVELHALISTDGSVESLEVISGDPMFIQSALTAVRDWRYQPTLLNGQPVEVDTHITVIYTLAH